MTPQRTLRGKRHIRARKTVQIGRDRKRARKLNRDMRLLSQAIANLPNIIVQASITIANVFQSIHEAINSFVIASQNAKALELYQGGDVLGAQKEILNRMEEKQCQP
jgi:hypothetical protein